MRKIHIVLALAFALVSGESLSDVTNAVSFVLDESGSISSAEFQLETQGFVEAVDLLPATGQVEASVVGFASQASVVIGSTVIDGTGKPAVRNALLNNTKAGGGTNMSAAITTATTVLSTAPAPSRVICLATDGVPNSTSAALAAADSAKAEGIKIVPIGIGLSASGKQFLDSIASDPPVANPTSFEEFAEVVSTACIGEVRAGLNIQLAPDPISFGTVTASLAEPLYKAATLSNAGTNPSWVTGIFLRGDDAAQFGIVSVKDVPFSAVSFPFLMPAAQTVPISVELMPTSSPADGTYDAELVVVAEDGLGSSIEVVLTLFANVGTDVFSVDVRDAYPVVVRIDSQNRPIAGDGANVTEEDVLYADRERTGLVADGNARLFLRAKTTVTSGNVQFRIVAPTQTYAVLHTLSESPQEGGDLTVTVPVEALASGLGQASAIVRAGNRFPSVGEATEARFIVEACLLDEQTGVCGALLDRVTLGEKRAPVVLVHGIWSSAKAMKKKKNKGVFKALADAQYQLAYFDYSADGDDTADDGPTQVMTAETNDLRARIVAECLSLNQEGFACTRADLVTHSMGGLVARKYVYDNQWYRLALDYREGSIRRLVTVGTPHRGSPLANLLLKQELGGDCPIDENPEEAGIQNKSIDEAIDLLGNREVLDPGAVGDLAEDSDLLLRLNAVEQRVPTFAIVGDIGKEIDLVDWVDNLIWPLPNLLSKIEGAGCDYAEIFGETRSDGIVPTTSAQGRVTSVSTYNGVKHTTLMESDDIGSRVVTLLDGPLSEFAEFASRAVSPSMQVVLEHSDSGEWGANWSVLTQALGRLLANTAKSAVFQILGITGLMAQELPEIELSADRAEVPPGESVVFTASVSETPTSSVFLIDSDRQSWEDSEAPYEWRLTLPKASSGSVRFSAAAEFNGQFVSSNGVDVTVMPDMSGLLQLTFEPARPLIMFVGKSEQLAVEGRFRDGYIRDLTEAAVGTTYREQVVTGLDVSEGDSPAIEIGENGFVRALAAGEAQIVAENSGFSNVRQVRVFEWGSLVDGVNCDIDESGGFDGRDVAAFQKGCKGQESTWICDLNDDGQFNGQDVAEYQKECRSQRKRGRSRERP